MAGIGFELKKIYRKKHILNLLQGIGYSTIVSIGPTIITMIIILAMYKILDMASVGYARRELLSSTILYSFIFPLIVSTPFNTVLSRYIADKIFQRKIEDILPAYYIGMIITVMLMAVLAMPFCIRLYLVSTLNPFFIFSTYCLMMSIVIIFYSMIYLTATKDYKIITMQFVGGMLIALMLGIVFVKVLSMDIIEGILYALTIGFFCIASSEFTYIRRYFATNSKNYKECLSYVFGFKRLFLSGLLYALGLYCHNFVFWTSELSITVENSYITAPSYDMATYIAMLTNISTMVIFIVMAETSFHERYQIYSEAIIRSTRREIDKAKNDMFRLLIQQISFVVQVQAIITCIIFFLVVIFFPSIGFSGITMQLYPALTAAYYVIFLMYCNVVFLYYFADMTGAFLTTLFFFLGVLIGSIISMQFSVRYYGVGAFAGALIGWTFSFFRIYYLEKHFDAHIYQKGELTQLVKRKIPTSVSFQLYSGKRKRK